MRSAADRLSAAGSMDGLAALLSDLGFGTVLPLDAATRTLLGVHPDAPDARVAAAHGALRALLLAAPSTLSLRDTLAHAATQLSARAPHALWLLAVVESGARETGAYRVALACWSGDRHPPRIRTLLVDRRRILDSDAETVCALAAAGGGSDLAMHARWVEVLGRDALTRGFFRALQGVVERLAGTLTPTLADDERHELALLHVSRLLFLAFLEAKGWLDGDGAFLSRRFDACMASGGRYHARVLRPLFFGTLNTRLSRRAPAARAFGRIPFLNGGLFARTALERRHRHSTFPDSGMGAVFGDLLDRYRFTAREESTAAREAAVDPEMLGRAFESLMASRERRATGAFYTPFALVERTTTLGLRAALCDDAFPEEALTRALAGEALEPAYAMTLGVRVQRMTVVDPACGSGAFLVHALAQLALLARAAGDLRPLSDVRRELLARAVFGVDVNPMAVWLCELRLWLASVVDSEERDPMKVPTLPNLDHHVRVGDALGGAAFRFEPGRALMMREGHRLATLRARYARATGARKGRLARLLDSVERERTVDTHRHAIASIRAARREELTACRRRDLFGERHRPTAAESARMQELRARELEVRRSLRRLECGGALPFSWGAHFADIAAQGGFTLVIGNPPWVRLHRIAAAARLEYRREYAVYRHAAWELGATAARAASGFGAQVDLAALFLERSLRLLRPGGALSLLLPSKLWRSLAGGGVRRLLATDARLAALEDFSEAPAAFDAAVYPSLLVAVRQQAADVAPLVRLSHHRRTSALEWQASAESIPLDESAGSPWLTLPPEVRAGFDRLSHAGEPLSSSRFGRPLLGIKTGCNEAFVVTRRWVENGAAQVLGADGRGGEIEAALLRPLLRGERMSRWRTRDADRWVIWTHADDGTPLVALPPHAGRWLAAWRRALIRRSDLRTGTRWWSLFRLEGAACDAPRVAWADFGRRPHAVVLPAGSPDVPLNSCYVLRCPSEDDAFAMAALLNGPAAAAWLNAVAEPARGGFRRYLAWTVGLLPLPRDWHSARERLAPLGRRGFVGDEPPDTELLEASAACYGVSSRCLAPLLTWTLR